MINLIIDAKLVRVIRSDLKKKLRFQSADKIKLQNMLAKKKSIEIKTSVMIVLSVVIYTFCRLPELGAKFFFFFYANDTNQEFYRTCNTFILCYLLSNSVEYLYMLAYTFNFFINYKFNSSFQAGYHNYFNLKSSRKETTSVRINQ